MKQLLCIGLCWFAFSHWSLGQKSVSTVDLPGDLLWAGVDRPGDLTVVLRTGDLIKYDKNGKKQGQYRFPLPPTLYDPLDGAQSFFFDRVTNTYGFLDATMTTENRHPMDPAFAISPWLVCPVLHELWILDAADFNIKKTKLHAAAISLEMQLKHLPQKQVEDYTFLREYQNYTFLLDQTSGIHIFNSLGKYVRTEGEPGLDYFNFLGEELYYKKGGELIMIDLYSGEKRKIGLPHACRFALLTDERMYLADTRKVTILEYKP